MTHWGGLLTISVLNASLEAVVEPYVSVRILSTDPRTKHSLIKKRTAKAKQAKPQWNTTFEITKEEFEAAKARTFDSLKIRFEVYSKAMIRDKLWGYYDEIINESSADSVGKVTRKLINGNGSLCYQIKYKDFSKGGPPSTVEILSKAIFPDKVGPQEFEALLGRLDRNLINDPDSTGTTLLYKSARAGRTDIVTALLKVDGIIVTGAQTSTKGSTPMHTASYYGHHAILKALLAKADPEQNNDGIYPYEETPTVNKLQIHDLWSSYLPPTKVIPWKPDTTGGRIQVDEFVTGDIISMEFDLDNAAILERPLMPVMSNYNNKTDETTYGKLKLNRTEKLQKSWTFDSNLTINAEATVSCGFPMFAEGNLTLGAEASFDIGRNKTKTEEKTFEQDFNIPIPPHSRVQATALICVNQMDVPFIAKVKKIHRKDPTKFKIEEVRGVFKDATNTSVSLSQVVHYESVKSVLTMIDNIQSVEQLELIQEKLAELEAEN